jgi:hypothetical protein
MTDVRRDRRTYAVNSGDASRCRAFWKDERHSMKRFAFTLVVAALAAAFGPRGAGAMAPAGARTAQQTAEATAQR